MKWIFPSTCYVIAAYMWRLNTANSNTMIAVGTIFAMVFLWLEFKS